MTPEQVTDVGDHAEKKGLGKLNVMALPDTRAPPTVVVNTIVAATPVLATTEDPAAIEMDGLVTTFPMAWPVNEAALASVVVFKVMDGAACAELIIVTPVRVIVTAVLAAKLLPPLRDMTIDVDDMVAAENVRPALVIPGIGVGEK